jgi:hypothetical protein
MLAEFGTGQVFLSILWFFLFFMWIMLLFRVFADIFRDHSMSGFAKVLWIIFVIVLPFLGVFVYLIARGGSMVQRDAEAMRANEEAFRAYVQSAAGPASPADELARLADLRERNVIDDAEFARLKAKVIS